MAKKKVRRAANEAAAVATKKPAESRNRVHAKVPRLSNKGTDQPLPSWASLPAPAWACLALHLPYPLDTASLLLTCKSAATALTHNPDFLTAWLLLPWSAAAAGHLVSDRNPHSMSSALRHAADCGMPEVSRGLVLRVASLGGKFPHEALLSALRSPVYHGDEQVLTALLAMCDVAKLRIDFLRFTATWPASDTLACIVEHGSLRAVELVLEVLLSRLPDVTSQCIWAAGAVAQAARDGKDEVMQLLLGFLAPHHQRLQADHEDCVPRCKFVCCQELLDVSLRSAVGWACDGGHEAVCRMLLQYERRTARPGFLDDEPDVVGDALESAAACGYSHVYRLLAAERPDIWCPREQPDLPGASPEMLGLARAVLLSVQWGHEQMCGVFAAQLCSAAGGGDAGSKGVGLDESCRRDS